MSIARFIAPCLLALSPWFWGCAHVQQPPSAKARASFGTVGVVSTGTDVKGGFGAPTGGKGAGAAKGAALWAIASPLAGLEVGGVGVVAGVLFTPVAALTGAVYGAVVAEPGAKVKEAEDSIAAALKNIDIRQAMLAGAYKAARDRAPCNVIPVFAPTKEGPASPGEGAGVGYQDLKAFGIDTALVIDVFEYGLDTGAKGIDINPPIPLILKVRVRLVRCPDGTELYANEFTYKGQSRKYLEWASSGAKSLVDEINLACETLSRQVVDEALLGIRIQYMRDEDTIWYLLIPGKKTDRNARPKYVPGFEPSTQKPLRDLFEPPDKHKLDEDPYSW